MSKLTEFLMRHKGHALIADSKDWDDVIAPALVEYGDIEATIEQTGGRRNLLRVMFETVYQLGYERGKDTRELAFYIQESGDPPENEEV